jgi:hypothetical protein
MLKDECVRLRKQVAFLEKAIGTLCEEAAAQLERVTERVIFEYGKDLSIESRKR